MTDDGKRRTGGVLSDSMATRTCDVTGEALLTPGRMGPEKGKCNKMTRNALKVRGSPRGS